MSHDLPPGPEATISDAASDAAGCPQDRRRLSRLPVRGNATLETLRGSFECSVENLSAMGLLVAAGQGFKVGASVSVLIEVPECQRSHRVSVHGVVRQSRPRMRTDRSAPFGVGIHFVHATGRTYRLMADLARGTPCPLCDTHPS